MSKFKEYLEATSTIKKPKLYKIESERSRMGGGTSYSYYVGTLEELIKTFSYTLEKGASWQHEKGNKKINRNPKNIKSLISNIYIMLIIIQLPMAIQDILSLMFH